MRVRRDGWKVRVVVVVDRRGVGKLGRTGGILIPILLFLLVHGLKRPL